MKNKKVYWVWADMKSRCRNKNHKAFANYGGRGIRVCDKWNNFDCFESDMGERPEGGMLDRIDNNGNYTQQNCRWATRKEQNSNRRNCIYVYDGEERVTLKEMCRRLNITYRPVVKRIRDRGWPIDKALSIPIGTGKHSHKFNLEIDEKLKVLESL